MKGTIRINSFTFETHGFALISQIGSSTLGHCTYTVSPAALWISEMFNVRTFNGFNVCTHMCSEHFRIYIYAGLTLPKNKTNIRQQMRKQQCMTGVITYRVAFGPTAFSAKQNTACKFCLKPALTIAWNAPKIAAAPPQSRFMPGIDVFCLMLSPPVS